MSCDAARLDRFVKAQDRVWPQVLAELGEGAKQSHWMWFVFPQLKGLGRSETARFYGIRGMEEARAYLAHPVLGPRLAQAADAVLGWVGRRSAGAVFGPVDAMKLRSSATLFEEAGGGERFAAILDGFYGGERDPLTRALLR